MLFNFLLIPYCNLMDSVFNLNYSIFSKRKTADVIRSLLFAEILIFLSFLFIYPISASIPSYVPIDSISLDCSSSNFPSSLKMSSSPSEFKNKSSSVVSRIIDSNSFQNRRKPYPCIFRKQTTYTVTVSPGQKFIRLHFEPIPYPVLDISKALFSVSVAGYTLINISKFSQHNLLVDYAVREFCININDQTVNVTFSPSLKISDSFAFVNKIEVVSMPSNLYIQKEFSMPIVGSPYGCFLENSTALEMMHRVNIGGDLVPPEEDSGMSRLWLEDSNYLMSDKRSARIMKSRMAINISSSIMPALYAAPEKVYASARIVDIKGNLAKWSFPVDPGFCYLVRLHFCDISGWIQGEEGVFHVSINNHTVENHANVFQWSHGAGVPTYKDYIVNFSRHSDDGIKYLSVAIGLHNQSEGLAILNGLEIFKLSDESNNLAGPYPFGIINDPTLYETEDLKWLIITIWSFLGFDMVLILLCLMILQLPYESWPSLLVPLPPFKQQKQENTTFMMQQQTSNSCQSFTFAEMKAATNNFSNSLLIGAGGFGKVYKGTIKGYTMQHVAIKRANPDSHQGLNEFQNEVSLLSKLRHGHLVSLVGYCLENKEMILVYEYIIRGTLRDHLYKTNNPPLPWNQRLKICIGAARGLHYLHTNANHTIIHRDVKSTNILLDENWVAKVSDFGLSRIGPNLLTQSNTHVSTVVKGSFGYLDPEYYRRRKLTEKSDVYSFGVVLFEVLCARPAVLPMEDENQVEMVNLAEWSVHCCQLGTIDQMIDPYLQGKIDPTCLKTYVDIARMCLGDRGSERPTMGEVLWNLEQALLQQQKRNHFQELNTDNDHVADKTYIEGQGICFGDSDPTPGLEFSDIIIPTGR
ncbi:hypothetical protein CCACVL1_06441 [Corchorus capsularis]|uniref:Protein kinase domain-containing protein n=1 Tax=Corchorus capsularis TaxID=210143 RepID=A0A1R3JFI9_COCAP|nr:hypothetical protein CCACVL1_06441 [Corchorus capsularis]